MKRIAVAGAGSPICLYRHIGEATEDRAKEIKHQDRNEAGDNEAGPDQLAAPAK